jgi:dTDP-4-dehydrorhamnose reductase
MKKKIWIMGCGGMLGEAFYNTLREVYDVYAYDIDLNTEWLRYGDIIDFQQCKVEVEKVRPNVIINLAALTSLEYCEEHPSLSYKTNTFGVENLLHLAKIHDIPFIHISTAGVYNGSRGKYHEYDIPNPICVYGKSKHDGEKIALAYSKAYVFRAGWMMGGGIKDKKFIKLIADQIKSGSKTIYAVTDKQGTPTYTYNFVKTVMKCLEDGAPYGLYNTVCSGDCSRYDVAKYLCSLIDSTIEVVPVTSEYFAKTYFANRPPDESLITFKLDALKLNYMGDWKTALTDYVNKTIKQYIASSN